MFISIRACATALAIVGAIAMFVTGTLAIYVRSWGEPLMNAASVVAPGVTGADWRSVFLLMLYAAIDGAVFGSLFAWLYNRLAGGNTWKQSY